MILAYALGGGLGHVTRVRALASTLRWTEPLTILTSNPAATDPRVCGTATTVLAPLAVARDRRGLEAFVRDTAARVAPDRVVIDTFPDGILHELKQETFAAAPLTHVTRAVKWAAYDARRPDRPDGRRPGDPDDGGAASGRATRYAVTYATEPLPSAQRTALAARSLEVVDLDLRDVDEPARDQDGRVVEGLRAALGAEDVRPLWIVVHSGPEPETLELVAYAREVARGSGADPHLVVLTRARPDGLDPEVVHLDLQPAWPLFGHADRVFAAAGSNVVRQLQPHRATTSLLPFERRYDDQHARARRWRSEPPLRR